MNYKVQIAVGPPRHEDETLAEYLNRNKKAKRPKYYECGICDSFHSVQWNGDCREDSARHTIDELDAKYGPLGWTEIPMEDLL